ncbi:MAG: 30S ribosome-binding factor RbfA [Phycisphaerales bacterium]|nr:30S ribosome-binding factor RbfA [Phycisphaerales bacterium]
MSRRGDQVSAALREAVQGVIDRGLQDPRISGLITVTGVTVDEDLRHAIVRVTILPAERERLAFHGLRAASAHIRHEASKRLTLRRTPDLSFRLDAATKKQAGVIEALARVAAERERTGTNPPTEPTP